jgi:hypothetical protein
VPDSLFSLPEYDHAFLAFINDSVQALAAAKDPVLATLPRARPGRMYHPRNTVAGEEEPLDSQPVTVRSVLELNIADIESCDDQALIGALDRQAEEYVASIMPQLFAALGRASEAVGTSIDAGGQPLSAEVVAEALELMEIDFDDDGTPRLPSIAVGEGAELPEDTPEGRRIIDDVIARKREQFLAQRRHRQLPRHSLRG